MAGVGGVAVRVGGGRRAAAGRQHGPALSDRRQTSCDATGALMAEAGWTRNSPSSHFVPVIWVTLLRVTCERMIRCHLARVTSILAALLTGAWSISAARRPMRSSGPGTCLR